MNADRLQHAIRLHESGKIAEAAAIFADILRADPNHLDALYRLGHIHLQNGRADRKSTRLNSSHVSESRMPSSA